MLLDATMNVATDGKLSDFTGPALVAPWLRERDTPGIIGELSQMLQRQGVVTDLLPFYHAALNQALLSDSAVGCGLAFPHARLSGVKQLKFAFGRAPDPINWGAPGSGRAQFIFLLAVPATDAASYLHLMASLARLGRQPELLDELRSAPNAEAILAVLERIKLRQG